jgi:hypothetical protein
MPVFINEVTAEVPQPQVSATQAKSVENTTKVSPTEYEFLMNLNIIEERKQRLDFD